MTGWNRLPRMTQHPATTTQPDLQRGDDSLLEHLRRHSAVQSPGDRNRPFTTVLGKCCFPQAEVWRRAQVARACRANEQEHPAVSLEVAAAGGRIAGCAVLRFVSSGGEPLIHRCSVARPTTRRSSRARRSQPNRPASKARALVLMISTSDQQRSALNRMIPRCARHADRQPAFRLWRCDAGGRHRGRYIAGRGARAGRHSDRRCGRYQQSRRSSSRTRR